MAKEKVGDIEDWGGILYEIVYVGKFVYIIEPIKDKNNEDGIYE